MSSPRHLWSGEWQLESAASAEELARRRARAEPPSPPEPEPPPRPKRKTRRRVARPSPRAIRVGAVAVLVALLCAGTALGVSSLVSGSGSEAPSRGETSASLGMDLASLSVGGVLVKSVLPKGAGYLAGLRPGDVITEVADQRVESPADVDSAIAPLHPGERVKIQFDRGPATYMTQATLQKRPPGSP